MPPIFQSTKQSKQKAAKPKTPIKKPRKVNIIESERGWGQRVDEVREFIDDQITHYIPLDYVKILDE